MGTTIDGSGRSSVSAGLIPGPAPLGYGFIRSILLAALLSIASTGCGDAGSGAPPAGDPGHLIDVQLGSSFERHKFLEARLLFAVEGDGPQVVTARRAEPVRHLWRTGSLVKLVDLRTEVDGFEHVFIPATASVVSASVGEHGRLVVTVARRSPLAGIVVSVLDASKQPVRGADVLVRSRRRGRSEREEWTVTTDDYGYAGVPEADTGEFDVELVSAGQFGMLERQEAEAYWAAQRSIQIDADATGPVFVQLTTGVGGSLEILVSGLDAKGSRTTSEHAGLTLRRIWEDGVQRSLPRSPRATRATGPGGEALFSVRGVPAGRYLIGVHPQGARAMYGRIEIIAGEASRLHLASRGPGGSLELRAPAGETLVSTEVSFNLNAILEGVPGDLSSGDLLPGTSTKTISGLGAGRYALVIWNSGVATFITKSNQSRQVTPLRIPDDLLTAGSSAVTVTARRDGQEFSCRRVFVAIQPTSGEPFQDGDWMRFHSGLPAKFEGIPSGRYYVGVFDGVFGVDLSLAHEPLLADVTVGSQDVGVLLELR